MKIYKPKRSSVFAVILLLVYTVPIIVMGHFAAPYTWLGWLLRALGVIIWFCGMGWIISVCLRAGRNERDHGRIDHEREDF